MTKILKRTKILKKKKKKNKTKILKNKTKKNEAKNQKKTLLSPSGGPTSPHFHHSRSHPHLGFNGKVV